MIVHVDSLLAMTVVVRQQIDEGCLSGLFDTYENAAHGQSQWIQVVYEGVLDIFTNAVLT